MQRAPWTTASGSLAILLAMAFPSASAAPVRPSDDALVLATVAAGSAEKSPRLRAERAALASDRGNLKLALQTARNAIEQGRANADPRSYGQAQAALSTWWTEPEPPTEIRLLRAVIRQAYHDFASAAADLDAIIAQSPGNAQARLSRAFVRMVTGDITGAGEDCRNLPPTLGAIVLEVCNARVDALSGKAAEGYDRLAATLKTDATSREAMRQFAAAVLADMSIGLGRNEDATRFFAATESPDVAQLAAHADQLLDAGRPGEALDLLEGKGEADILILRRAIAAKRLKDPRLAGWSAILNERFAAAAAGGIRVHLREEARFRLEVEGDVGKALPLAIENWAVQKEPADARLLLECAIASNDHGAAQPVLGFIRQTGLRDARLTPLLARLGERY